MCSSDLFTLTGGIAMGDQVVLIIVVIVGKRFLDFLLCVHQCQAGDVCVGITVYCEAFAPVAFYLCQVIVGVIQKINTEALFDADVNGVVFGGLVRGVTQLTEQIGRAACRERV